MSRAFTREGSGSDAVDKLPDRPVSPHRNLVTPEGLRDLDAALAAAEAALDAAREAKDDDTAALAARDLRYFTARRASAEVVAPHEPADQVRFAARVTILREDGRQQTFRIVGEDEADPAKGKLSYVSPLARVLADREEGDVVPFGSGEIEILKVE
ncbi:Transcript cleavage factor GreA [Hartmannibacter diazotrophicus]|uniref:Transcript cleavage factor GreA n=1 Tax=Hartmannibacter diazotrophicus TaxID=1482074 RepID=A0A2C9D1N2_9HYPH|nr:transcription elongation factor GreA [Hartmannibacter diazotrophicus]SON54134.1 Transcript cleavage factor GreA [Hartmannibacter diazotrophicus]